MNGHDFSLILNGLGQLIGMDLFEDSSGMCMLLIDEMLMVSLQQDVVDDSSIIICAFIYELPPGEFKKNVFKSALLANNARKKPWILSFCSKKTMLVMHGSIPIKNLTAEFLFEELQTIVEDASQWRSALASGRSTPDGW